MRAALFFLPLLALVACAPQRDRCINDATRDVKIRDSLIAQTRANIDRGFALEQRQELRSRTRLCRFEREDGSTGRRLCEDIDTVTTTTPVTIDIAAEREKLAALEALQNEKRQMANQAIAQCIAAYPDT